jgi:hypothetical protein
MNEINASIMITAESFNLSLPNNAIPDHELNEMFEKMQIVQIQLQIQAIDERIDRERSKHN